MNVIPKDGGSSAASQAAKPQSARERAIAKFNSGLNAAQAPVQNPTQVGMEELGALKVSPEASQVAEIASEVQSDSSEAAVSPAAPSEATKAPEEPISSQFAVLARKEKALRAKALAQEQAIKAREEAFKAKEAEFAAREVEYKSKYIPKDMLAKDPLSALSEAGLTFDELTNLALNAPKPEDLARDAYLKKLEAKISELENSQKKVQQSYEDQQAQSYKQALNQIRLDATDLINSDPQFETIKETGSIEDVVELVERTFKEENRLISVEQAAKHIEDYLMEEALKITKIKKIQDRLKAQQAPVAPAAKAEAPKQAPKQTLTNSMASSKPLSARERAIAAFKGELKS